MCLCYLNNCYHSIIVKDKFSSICHKSYAGGTTEFSSQLYIIYTSGLLSCINDCKYYLHAAYCTLSHLIKLNADLEKRIKKTQNHGFAMKPQKKYFMIFGNTKRFYYKLKFA